MKKIYRTPLLLAAFFLLVSANIYFDILVPAAVDIPAHISSMALIDRSHSENEVVNVLEKGLLSAISGQDDRLSKYCIEGAHDQILSNNKIKPVITGIVEKRPGTALDFPKPMEWFEVVNICKQHGTDAVLALEIFSRQYIDNVAEVKVGFRLYDPAKKMILDEFLFYHGIGKGGQVPGDDPGALVLNTLNTDDALKKAGYIAGTIYGKRITPFWIRAERKYYKRSKRDPYMAEGARMMEVNNWDAAIEALQAAIETGHRKTKGRAAHNLAVVYEITGQPELAYETAQVAWGKYRNKASREYSEILQYRLREINQLRNQEER
jgi:hypothetical protein